MAEVKITVRAKGVTPAASLAELGVDPGLNSAKFLQIAVTGPPSRKEVFAVDPNRRQGATGNEIQVMAGHLGLDFNKSAAGFASPATHWAYRRSQLINTPSGRLLLGTLIAAWVAAWIDGSLAIGDKGVTLFVLEAKTLGTLSFVSLIAKMISAALAFLLAFLVKK
jgi:hypothetical protein